MKIILNGKVKEVCENLSVNELLEQEEIIEPITVEVYINKKQIHHKEYDIYEIKSGDEVEYLYLFAGG